MLCPNAQAAPSCLVLVLRTHTGSQQRFNASEPVPSLQQKQVIAPHHDALQSQPPEATRPEVILAQYLGAHVESVNRRKWWRSMLVQGRAFKPSAPCSQSTDLYVAWAQLSHIEMDFLCFYQCSGLRCPAPSKAACIHPGKLPLAGSPYTAEGRGSASCLASPATHSFWMTLP